jgi:hypothetical protein
MTLRIHILRRRADVYIDYWCPFCDEVVKFGHQYYYEEIWCTKCSRTFGPYWRHHKFPKGIDMQTGELEESNAETKERETNGSSL